MQCHLFTTSLKKHSAQSFSTTHIAGMLEKLPNCNYERTARSPARKNTVRSGSHEGHYKHKRLRS